MTEQYWKCAVENFLKHPEDPLRAVSAELESLIRADIDELRYWFRSEICEDFCRSEADFAKFELRLARIYAMVIMEASTLSYTRGLLRIGCICISMSMGFSDPAKLSDDFAEAIAFYLTKNIISIIPVRRLIDNRAKLINHFNILDQMIRKEAPEVFKLLQESNQGAVGFALQFEMFLYSDNHSPFAVMDIWDQIFARWEELSGIVQCLTVAHVKQVKIPEGCTNLCAVIIANKQWDLVRLVNDAVAILAHKRSCGEECCLYFCPKLTAFHGYEAEDEWE
jgi:hypothetical protein